MWIGVYFNRIWKVVARVASRSLPCTQVHSMSACVLAHFFFKQLTGAIQLITGKQAVAAAAVKLSCGRILTHLCSSCFFHFIVRVAYEKCANEANYRINPTLCSMCARWYRSNNEYSINSAHEKCTMSRNESEKENENGINEEYKMQWRAICVCTAFLDKFLSLSHTFIRGIHFWINSLNR